ncbi:MAG TPA: RNA 2',3'-cyclic phosphodiesterase [Bacillota bacterium]|nr:RNA 2',3'-cyclic phosphodiesterase [Bacillota bacterium]
MTQGRAVAEMRAFVAVEVSDAVRAEVGEWSAALRAAGADYRWVDPANYHLTLKFLGAIDPGRMLSPLQAALTELAAGMPPVAVTCQGIGCFPGWGNPRVLWVGLGDGRAAMTALACAVDRATLPLGFAESAKDPTPHLTLARQRSPSGSSRLLEAVRRLGDDRVAGSFTAGEILLMESRLSPAGPTYGVKGRFRLGAPAPDSSQRSR